MEMTSLNISTDIESTPAPRSGNGADSKAAVANPALMRVRKRDGRLEAVNVLKIVDRVTRRSSSRRNSRHQRPL